MSFTSIPFLLFLIACLAVYHFPGFARLGASWQWGLLALSSLVFYAWDNPHLLWLLGFSMVFNSFAGKAIARHVSMGQAVPRRLMVFAIAVNLLLLASFKYAGLLGELFLQGEGFKDTRKWLAEIPLPIGISFYTFHAVSFLVDLSRAGTTEPKLRSFADELTQGNFLRPMGKICLYINFFPQLVAGPIMKARDFMPQIGAKATREIHWRLALRYLIMGYFLKAYVADNLVEQTNTITTPNVVFLNKLDLIALLYGYSFRIFADFAGYSLIALGLAALFGYRLPINFNFPYNAASITEFWKRWHISLSTWLRDYLYFPLGGNRKGNARTYLNLFLVMFLGGLWHGAAWKFALWGSAHGVFLAIERLLGVKADETTCASPGGWRKLIGIAITFNLVSMLWLLFLMPDMEALFRYFEAIKNAPLGLKGRWAFSLLAFGAPVVLYHLWGYLRPKLANPSQALTSRTRTWAEASALALMLYLTLTNSGVTGEFIYFQF